MSLVDMNHAMNSRSSEALLEAITSFSKVVEAPDRARFSQDAVERLRSMDESKRSEILKSFSVYSSLIQGAIEKDPGSANDEVRLLRQVAQQMRLIFSEEVYSLARRDDIIEIYNKDFVQVYRGLGFMDVCNYTLLELLTYEFHELYERPESVNGHLFNAARILSERGRMDGVSMAHVPKHLMRERFTKERAVSQVAFRHVFPIYQWPKEFFGFLIIQNGENYGNEVQSSKDEIRFL